MFAPHEPRRPYVLTGLTAGVLLAWIVSEVLDLPGLPSPWPGVLAGLAVLSALVARRVARALPAGLAPDDAAAVVEPVREEAPAPRRGGTWPIVRGLLAIVGALTLGTGTVLYATSVVGPALQRLFGADATCTLGARYEPADANVKDSPNLNIDGHRSLKTFTDTGE